MFHQNCWEVGVPENCVSRPRSVPCDQCSVRQHTAHSPRKLCSNHYLGYNHLYHVIINLKNKTKQQKTLTNFVWELLLTLNLPLVWFELTALASLPFWKQFLYERNIFRFSGRKFWENIATTGNIIAFILYHSIEFFPVLDRLGCDRDCRGNDNFVSIMLEGVRCSKFIKIFSSLWFAVCRQDFVLRLWRTLFLSVLPYIAECVITLQPGVFGVKAVVSE